MPKERIFPPKLTEFNDYVNIAIPYLDTNAVRLKVPALPLAAVKLLHSDLINNNGWLQVYPLTIDEVTATKALRNRRDFLRPEIEKTMRIIFDDIPESVLTENDRLKLRLKKRDTVPTAAVVMDHAPDMDVEKFIHLQHTLRFSDPENPDSDEMPENQKIILENHVGVAGIADDQIPFSNAKNITRFTHIAVYTEAEVGKTAYYRACYESTRGERSAWGAVVKAVVA